jgi:hypothetical protein
MNCHLEVRRTKELADTRFHEPLPQRLKLVQILTKLHQKSIYIDDVPINNETNTPTFIHGPRADDSEDAGNSSR